MTKFIEIREAPSWVKNIDYDTVVVEYDCLQIIQAIRNSFMYFSCFGRVIEKYRVPLTSLIAKNVKFKFVKRLANKVADYVA